MVRTCLSACLPHVFVLRLAATSAPLLKQAYAQRAPRALQRSYAACSHVG